MHFCDLCTREGTYMIHWVGRLHTNEQLNFAKFEVRPAFKCHGCCRHGSNSMAAGMVAICYWGLLHISLKHFRHSVT